MHDFSGNLLRQLESYLSWCQYNSNLNLLNMFALSQHTLMVIVVFICQCYIQYHAGLDISWITFKHTFVAIGVLITLVPVIFLLANPTLNVPSAVPAATVVGIVVAIGINVGFLLKEHIHTFPVIKSLLTNPCMAIMPEPVELQMYPINE